MSCLLFYTRQGLASLDPITSRSASLVLTASEKIMGKIVVGRFKIIGNDAIASDEIARVVRPYLWRPISFVELLEVQQVITQL